MLPPPLPGGLRHLIAGEVPGAPGRKRPRQPVNATPATTGEARATPAGYDRDVGRTTSAGRSPTMSDAIARPLAGRDEADAAGGPAGGIPGWRGHSGRARGLARGAAPAR